MIIFLKSFVLPGMAFGTFHLLIRGLWGGAIVTASAAIISIMITNYEKAPDE